MRCIDAHSHLLLLVLDSLIHVIVLRSFDATLTASSASTRDTKEAKEYLMKRNGVDVVSH